MFLELKVLNVALSMDSVHATRTEYAIKVKWGTRMHPCGICFEERTWAASGSEMAPGDLTTSYMLYIISDQELCALKRAASLFWSSIWQGTNFRF